MGTPEMAAIMEAHSVLPPLDVYIEIPGGK